MRTRRQPRRAAAWEISLDSSPDSARAHCRGVGAHWDFHNLLSPALAVVRTHHHRHRPAKESERYEVETSSARHTDSRS